MPVPKKKTSRGKRGMRRSHDGIKNVPNFVDCPNCMEPKMPHKVCPSCGEYGDKEVIEIEEK